MTRIVIEVEEDLTRLQVYHIISDFEEIIGKRSYTLYDTFYEFEPEED